MSSRFSLLKLYPDRVNYRLEDSGELHRVRSVRAFPQPRSQDLLGIFQNNGYSTAISNNTPKALGTRLPLPSPPQSLPRKKCREDLSGFVCELPHFNLAILNVIYVSKLYCACSDLSEYCLW